MIPKLFGAEVKKDIKTSTSGSARKKWDETGFFEATKEQTDNQYLPAIKKLYDFSKAKADEVKWGTGSTKGSFNPVFAKINTRSVYTVGTNGNLSLNFGWLNGDKTAVDFRDKLKNEVETKLKLTVPENYREHFISYPIAEWHDKADSFMSIIEQLTK